MSVVVLKLERDIRVRLEARSVDRGLLVDREMFIVTWYAVGNYNNNIQRVINNVQPKYHAVY